MEICESVLEPPRWARAFLLLTLPCDPIRDAILGDLHEEFLDDARARGKRSARARYVRRTAGIVVRAVSDALIWRAWESTGPVADSSRPKTRSTHAGGAGGFAGFVAVALIVLAIGVVVNTLLFSATAAHHAHASSAAGIGGLVLLVICVGIGTVVLCVGPRWRRNRR